MNRLVSKIDEKRLGMLASDVLDRVAAQDFGRIPGPIYANPVFVYFRVGVRPLSFEAYPAVEPGTRRIVVAHMPLADKSGFVAGLTQQQRKGHQPVTGGGAINVVGNPVGVRILAGEKAGARRRAERSGHKRVAEHRSFFADPVDVGRLDKWMTGNTQLVPPQVVNQDEHDVGPRVARRTRRTLGPCRWQSQQQAKQ